MPESKKKKFQSLNKGEWSELYTFLKICVDKYLPLVDSELNSKGYGFTILKAILVGTGFEYNLVTTGVIEKVQLDSNKKFEILDVNMIKPELEKIHKQILDSKGASFELSSLEYSLEKLGLMRTKAASKKKADIKLLVNDTRNLKEFYSGFSIKSKLGQPSTLLNASKATNFIYELIDFSGDADLINAKEGSQKIKDRLDLAITHSKSIVFHNTNAVTLKNNLIKVDTNLPLILSEMLMSFFSRGNRTVEDIVSDISSSATIKSIELNYENLKYIIAKFLIAVAFGMFPNSHWDGYYEAEGCIILEKSGDLLCLHIIEMKDIAEYLFKNTKFETASSGRNDFGKIYELDNRNFINLNLQIRFIN